MASRADARGSEARTDLHSRVMDMANERVWITSHMGKREKVTLFEARLIELTSDRCRRLFCQDFIELVLMAARTGPRAFHAGISEIDVTGLELEVIREFGVTRAF